jgi:L-rhamnose mutarotase
MKRYGFVIRLKPGAVEQYKRQHRDVWPDVLEMIHDANIRNYSIYLKDDLLFGYYEHVGTDHAADMARMAAHAKTLEWWSMMMPLQQPIETRRPGEWWAEMEEVFHLD